MEFKQAIKMYLDVNAMQDAAFKEKYSNPNKNIDECCLFIQSEMLKRVTKEQKESGAAVQVPTDEEVFAIAVRYYMDNDLKIDGTEFNNVKCLSMSATTFTAEEKAQMRKEAIEKYQSDVIAEQKKKDQERKEKAKKTKEKKPAAPVLVPDTPAKSEEPTNVKAEEKPKAMQMDLFGGL